MIGQTTIYLEELGKIYGLNLVVEADYCVYEGQKETRYQPAYDGSFEFFKAAVVRAYNEKFTVNRKESPDWFKILDEFALEKIQGNDRYEQEILTELAEYRIDSRW